MKLLNGRLALDPFRDGHRHGWIVAAGPLTKQEMTRPFRVVLRYLADADEFVVHDQFLDGWPHYVREVSYAHGAYYGNTASGIKDAVACFGERVAKGAGGAGSVAEAETAAEPFCSGAVAETVIDMWKVLDLQPMADGTGWLVASGPKAVTREGRCWQTIIRLSFDEVRQELCFQVVERHHDNWDMHSEPSEPLLGRFPLSTTGLEHAMREFARLVGADRMFLSTCMDHLQPAEDEEE